MRSPIWQLILIAYLGSTLISPTDVWAGVDAYKTIAGVSPEPVTEGAGLRGPADLETFLDGVMGATLNELHIAGAVVTVVKDGKLYFAKGYGYANVSQRVPMGVTTNLVRVGSISKLFTWTAVMQLVEQGKIDLDTDINSYLTQFKIPATFSQPITLRNLLTHTAGFEDEGYGYSHVSDPDRLVPLAKALGDHVPARVHAPAINFNDATMASYSNWGAALGGLIVENVSGTSFENYVEKNIFEPLEMRSSSFREPLPADLLSRLSEGYAFREGALKAQPFEYLHNVAPAGSLSSTAPDIAKFMIAHLANGAYGDRRILKDETARLMHSRQLSPSPYLSGGCLGFYEKYINGRRIIAHGGDTDWFHSDIDLLPDENIGIFVSYNSAASLPIRARDELLKAFMDRYYPAHLPHVTSSVDFASEAARFTGEYILNRHAYTNLQKIFRLLGTPLLVAFSTDNTLVMTTGGGVIKLVEVRPGVFRALDRETMVAFAGPPGGKALTILDPGAMAFISAYRPSWYETMHAQYSVFATAMLCFIFAIVSMLRNWRKDLSFDGLVRWARPVAGTLGLVNVAFAIMVTLALRQIDDISWPPLLGYALVLPLLSVPITAFVGYCAITIWLRKLWDLYARIQYTVISLAGVLFLWQIYYWNLIGFKFG